MSLLFTSHLRFLNLHKFRIVMLQFYGSLEPGSNGLAISSKVYGKAVKVKELNILLD